MTDAAHADTIALAHQVLAASQDPAGADQLRLLVRALSAAVLSEPRDQTTLVFDRDAADQATSAIVAFCAGSRRFTARRGLTARVVPIDGPAVTGELLDLDTSQDGQYRLVLAPVTDTPAPATAPLRIFDLFDDLHQVQILPPATVAPVHAPPAPLQESTLAEPAPSAAASEPAPPAPAGRRFRRRSLSRSAAAARSA